MIHQAIYRATHGYPWLLRPKKTIRKPAMKLTSQVAVHFFLWSADFTSERWQQPGELEKWIVEELMDLYPLVVTNIAVENPL